MSRDSRLAASLPSLLALLLAGSSAPAQTSARESLPLGVVSPCPGDVNLDGDRGPGDLALLSAHLSGQRTLTGQALGNADCNLDSFVDMGDVVRLTEHNTGKAQLVPCGDLEPLEVACPGLSFEKASAAPLEVVGLGTLPKEFAEPILAIVTDENEEVGTISFVERLEDGSATFFTPFFPGVVTEGGAVKVQLTDWKLSCPLADFAIEAIPPAPGELSRLVDALQEVLDVNVAAAGLTPEGLIAGEGELSQQAVPLALAQIVLDSPDNPNSLRAVSEGTAPVFEGTAETGLLDAVVAYLGIVEALGPESSGPSVAGRPSASNCGRSAADLDQCMRAALSDPDVPEEAKQNIAVSIAAFRDSPHSNTPLDLRLESARAHSAITMALAAGRWTEVAATALLPSILLPLKFDLNPAVMEEDLEFGEWTAEVSAFSKGWKLDRERVLEEIKVHPSHRRFQESLNLLGSQIDQVPALDKLAEGIVDTILQRPELAPHAREGDTLFEFGPEVFGPVPVHDRDGTDVVFVGAAVEEFNFSHTQYTPTNVGTGQIIVRLRTDGGKWGGAAPPRVPPKPVTVNQIFLDITPAAVALAPGQELEQPVFTVTVENSAFPKMVEATAEEGAVLLDLGENQHRIFYVPPPREKLPDTVTVRHTATTGARRSGPERTGKAEVREIAVPVNPEKLCVQPNEEIRIFHTVEGIEDQRVTWQTDTVPSGGDAGTVENGFFVAPGSPAIVEITATSVAEPQAKGRVQVRVGGCTCWWTVSIDGNLVVGKDEEDTASFTSVDDGLVINLVSQEGVVFLQRTGDVHSWFVSGSTLGINPPDLSYGTGEDEPVSGTLLDFTDTVVEGQIRGLVTILRVTNTGSEERLANFSAQFRVQANPLLSPLKACVVGEEIISP